MSHARSRVIVYATAAVRARFDARARAAIGKDVHWNVCSVRELEVESLQASIARLDSVPAAAIVFTPRRNASRAQLPYPIAVGGVPIGTVPYGSPGDIERWLRAVAAARRGRCTTLITAMQKPLYVSWAQRIDRTFRAARPKGGVTLRLPATTSCEDLVRELARGFRLCVYAGHGRSRGWSGYRGVRFADIESAVAMRQTTRVRGVERKPGARAASSVTASSCSGGTVISLSCSTLAFDREGVTPFGLDWLRSGTLAAFVGAIGSIEIEPLTRLTSLLLEARSAHRHRRLADLVRHVDLCARRMNDAKLLDEWSKFRMLGNPLQPV